MSDIDETLLHTGMPPEQVAQRLAEALGGTLTRHGNGGYDVRRPLADASVEGSVGGSVEPNEHREEHVEPGDESIYDGYDTIFEIWPSVPGEELQHTEAQRIFTEVTDKLPWPAAHLNDGGLLYSAWDPQRRRTDFPTGTTWDSAGHDEWKRYAHPQVPPQPPTGR